MLRSLRTPAASASSSSDRAIRLGATPASLERILSSSLSRSLTSAAVLGQAGPPRLAVGQLVRLERLGRRQRGHQPGADVVRPPAGRQPADPAQIVLGLGRMGGELAQRVVLDDPAARQVLGSALRSRASRASAFRRPSTAGLRLGSLSRFHASSGSKAKLDGSASRSISSSSQPPRPVFFSLFDQLRENRRPDG